MGVQMDNLVVNVSWLATLLGAALAHLVGWAWYSQTFLVIAGLLD